MKYTYVEGCRYKLVSKNKDGVEVETQNGIRKAIPCYIGWTYVGLKFANE